MLNDFCLRLKQLSRHFYKNLLVTDGLILIVIWIYNLLTLLMPLRRLRITGIILTFLIIDSVLIGIKLVNDDNFRSHR